jgi:hypothetical protein
MFVPKVCRCRRIRNSLTRAQCSAFTDRVVPKRVSCLPGRSALGANFGVRFGGGNSTIRFKLG